MPGRPSQAGRSAERVWCSDYRRPSRGSASGDCHGSRHARRHKDQTPGSADDAAHQVVVLDGSEHLHDASLVRTIVLTFQFVVSSPAGAQARRQDSAAGRPAQACIRCSPRRCRPAWRRRRCQTADRHTRYNAFGRQDHRGWRTRRPGQGSIAAPPHRADTVRAHRRQWLRRIRRSGPARRRQQFPACQSASVAGCRRPASIGSAASALG